MTPRDWSWHPYMTVLGYSLLPLPRGVGNELSTGGLTSTDTPRIIEREW